MKLKIKQNILMEHLNYVIKGISNKNLIPILNCIKFELKSEGLYLLSTDNEISIKTFIKKEDIENIKNFGKMLGTVDKDGQISMLEVTKNFIEMQIDKAKNEENKSSKLYKTLGVIVGLAFIVILI